MAKDTQEQPKIPRRLQQQLVQLTKKAIDLQRRFELEQRHANYERQKYVKLKVLKHQESLWRQKIFAELLKREQEANNGNR
jgi:hypothetical protein